MNTLLLLHLFSVGVWLGCIGTEVVLELDPAADRFQGNPIAGLHLKIDRVVETPAFLAVLLSGVLLFQNATVEPLLAFKIGTGMLAVALCAVCVVLTHRRHRALLAGDDAAFSAAHAWHSRLGKGVLVTFSLALVSGAYRLLG